MKVLNYTPIKEESKSTFTPLPFESGDKARYPAHSLQKPSMHPKMYSAVHPAVRKGTTEPRVYKKGFHDRKDLLEEIYDYSLVDMGLDTLAPTDELPFIRSGNSWCLVCGTEMMSVKSECCKQCEFLISSNTSRKMVDEDVAFLNHLRGDSTYSLKRKQVSGQVTQPKKLKVDLQQIHPQGNLKTEATTRITRHPSDDGGSLSPTSRRRRRHDEWTRREIVILLQCTKLLIDCELKCVSQALYHFINRKPGKCFGRAAEKKLKRLEIFENWRKSDKVQIVEKVDQMLTSYGSPDIPADIREYCDTLKVQSFKK